MPEKIYTIVMLLTTWCRVSVILTLHMYSTTADGCPTWFYYSNTTGHAECECGQSFEEKIQCDKQEKTVEIATGFCASRADLEDGLYYAGYCPFGHTSNMTNRIFSALPSNPDQLNEAMCGPYNRRGLLCGRCIDGYGPAVYSLDMRCANCSSLSVGSAISLYLFLEFFPITVFFLIVVLFRLNITGGPMLGYVLFCQGVMIATQYFTYTYESILSNIAPPLQVLLYITLALCDSWTLHVFRFLVHPFCISEKLTGIHIHMLSLLTSIYPVLLVVITCIIMELHARDCKLTRFVWKPFATCLTKLDIAMATGSSVIHAFATFILLSASTVIYNTLNIFVGTPVYYSTNATVYKQVLYSDPTIVLYSQRYIPYMLTAVVLLVSLALLPSLLLCLYPTRIYRALSRLVSTRKRLIVTIFAEALHSCFKDGLNGTWDYRALAGLATLAPVVLVSLTFGKINYHNSQDFSSGFIFLFLSFIFSYARPCKLTIANLSFSYHFMIFGTLSIAHGLWREDLQIETDTLAMMFVILPAVSHFLVFTWVGYRLIRCTISHLKHRGFNLKGTLTKFTSAVKQGFHRSRGGYQTLRDTVTQ